MPNIYSLFLWIMLCCCNSMMANPPSPREINHDLFASDVFQPANQTVCNGASTNTVVFVSSIPGTIFNWVNNNTSIGLTASGTGNIAAFTAINTGTAPVIATIIVTPTDGVTNGTPKSFTITVNPIPSVNAVSDQTLCAGTSSTAVNFTGSVPGTVYSWVNSNPAIGLAASGSGSIPSFTATNNTAAPITSTITATPSFGATLPELIYYKFEGSGTTVDNLASNPPSGSNTANIVGSPTQGGSGICSGTLIGGGGGGLGNHLNTNWIPNINGSWTISFRTANIPANGASVVFGFTGGLNMGCVQKGVDSWELQFFLNSTLYKVEVPGTAGTGIHTTTFVYNSSTNAVLGYGDGVLRTTVSLPAAMSFVGTDPIWLGGYGGSSFLLPAGALIDEFRMYNRVVSSTEINQLANTCTPGTACSGTPVSFDITVNPTPVLANIPDQSTCNNFNTIPVNFSSSVPGAVYNWTNNNTSIGLAASGTGNIASFTGINTGSSLVTATINVTAVNNTVPACSSSPKNFLIGVNPSPTASTNTLSQTICSGSANTPVTYTSNIAGTTYTWTRDNTTEVSGIGGNGTGNINGIFINNTNAPVTVIFTITPSRSGCQGTPFTATVTVGEAIPPSTVSPATQTICSGPITDIIPSSTFQGITYSWTRDNVTEATGIPASGTGPISGTLVNTTGQPLTVTFTIIPQYNGCDGTPLTATVEMRGVPTVVCPADIVTGTDAGLCSAVVTYNPVVNGIPAPDLTYSFSGATTGSGTGSGSGSVFNKGTTTVTITVTNSCGNSNCSFNITVRDTEVPVITCPANISVGTDAGNCSASVNTPNPLTSDNCGIIIQSWSLSGATTGNSSTSGINNLGTYVFNKGVTTVTYTVVDAADLVSNCSYTVTVVDDKAPVITCAANITATTPVGSCTATVNYTINATDNCPGVTTQLVAGPASGSAFPLGVTTVTWKAVDAEGNSSANCSFTVTVLDGQLPVISAQPQATTVCEGSNAVYSVTASNVVSYQWQQWNGLVWNDISGATTSTYTVNNVTPAMNTNTFRVRLNGLCSTVFSNAASLFVNNLPQVSISSTMTALQPGQTSTINALANPTGGSYAWSLNGNLLPGISGSSYGPLTTDQAGTYKVQYTDVIGCSKTSNDLLIQASASDNLWIYPNPSSGSFQVRYYNQSGEAADMIVYNAAGQPIMKKQVTTGIAYSRTDFDLSGLAQGVYLVRVIRSGGRELASKRVIVYHP